MSKKEVARYNLQVPKTLDKDIEFLKKIIEKEYGISISKNDIIRLILGYGIVEFQDKLTLKIALMGANYL